MRWPPARCRAYLPRSCQGRRWSRSDKGPHLMTTGLLLTASVHASTALQRVCLPMQGFALFSADMAVQLIMQGDGNVVL